ncbi:MAG: signal recognition particle-docking protein FtsY [Pseudomonadota bacterium]|nr:signal recognition particle-docking protein FtsY [Pseudomonadota bacterium]
MLSFLKKPLADNNNAQPSTSPAAGIGSKLRAGLVKTRERFRSLAPLFSSSAIDENFYEELETLLLTADCGVKATERILSILRDTAQLQKLDCATYLRPILRQTLVDFLKPLEVPLNTDTARPFVILLAGVNGAGKTTTIGKLACLFQSQGLSVLLAAGDTFRAAAKEQLRVWGERNEINVITQEGNDPSAVIYDAVTAANARNIDIVLADTAGRLPTQLHLMDEIRKIQRVIGKAQTGAPHEILLVLDANTGQNAINQVKTFHQALNLTGLVLTKLDGSARGGVLLAIAQECPVPVRFIGVGENMADIKPFIAEEFVSAMLD